jgi:hypothetical protein
VWPKDGYGAYSTINTSNDGHVLIAPIQLVQCNVNHSTPFASIIDLRASGLDHAKCWLSQCGQHSAGDMDVETRSQRPIYSDIGRAAVRSYFLGARFALDLALQLGKLPATRGRKATSPLVQISPAFAALCRAILQCDLPTRYASLQPHDRRSRRRTVPLAAPRSHQPSAGFGQPPRRTIVCSSEMIGQPLHFIGLNQPVGVLSHKR